jgi:hypothetical protein
MQIVLWLWNWSMEAKWRTWMFHGLLAFTLSGLLGAWAMMVAYLLGEIKDFVQKKAGREPIDPEDSFMDFAVPFCTAGSALLLGFDGLLLNAAAQAVYSLSSPLLGT